ncbi:MAG: hypothetical protein Q8Q85_12970 [Gemmatimonadales bacterium]|nr:hypothetical protein [Gemmatimonadales bacterium]
MDGRPLAVTPGLFARRGALAGAMRKKYTSALRHLRPFGQASAARRGVMLLLALGAAACRASGDGFVDPQPRFPLGGGFRRLTYNLGPDLTPVWSADGKSVSYAAMGLPPAAADQWLRVAVPVEGGTAVEEAAGYPSPFGTEALPVARAPVGTRAAVGFLFTSGRLCPCGVEPWPTVSDLEVVIVDLPVPLQSPSSLPTLSLTLAGLQFADSLGLGLVRVLFTPVFARRRDDRAAAFGPSWSPDGTRLVVSDGDRLWIWEVSTDAFAMVPGVSDAGFPHWSPDGTRIAFAHYARDSVRTSACVFIFFGAPACYASHTTTTTIAPDVWVVAPDGAGLTRVGLGEEAAWLPASNALLVRRGTGLVLVDLSTGVEQPIAGTAGAAEPAVSADGRRAAYVSRATGNQDVWTVDLSP